jgi:hypothetical protein
MREHVPLGLILLGLGLSLLGFIFGEPEYPLAGLRRQLEDMRIFGIEALQYKWFLAGAICLVLVGIFLHAVQRRKNSN